jgi:hypothetical protein
MPKFKVQRKPKVQITKNVSIKSLPTSLCLLSAGKRYQREEKYFPLLTKGDAGGLDGLFQSAKVLPKNKFEI